MSRRPPDTVADALAHGAAEARRSVAAAAVIALVGESAIAAIDARSLGLCMSCAARLVHAAMAAAALALLALGPRSSLRVANLAFALVAIPFLPVLWLAEADLTAHGFLRDHSSWYKLVMLGIAGLAPARPGFPASLIAALAVQAILQWHYVGHAPGLVGEPWITVVFAAISMGMLFSRVQRREAAERAARVVALAVALERVTRLLLRVRDRANTPLQTIELGTALLATRCPAEQRVTRAMQRAALRLRKLSGTLERAGQSAERSAEIAVPEKGALAIKRASRRDW